MKIQYKAATVQSIGKVSWRYKNFQKKYVFFCKSLTCVYLFSTKNYLVTVILLGLTLYPDFSWRTKVFKISTARGHLCSHCIIVIFMLLVLLHIICLVNFVDNNIICIYELAEFRKRCPKNHIVININHWPIINTEY